MSTETATPKKTYVDTLDTDIHTFLERHQNKQQLRFVAVGSVDDGKSTLIGRLLVDTAGAYDDQIAEASDEDGVVDLARLTDGLQAEREQGITIDVAYRYFTTPNRKFIIADTPGHIQYTRNMATGASTADVGVILIDARLGVLQQSRRHAYIASLLGIPRLLVAINKMDLVDFSEAAYTPIVAEFTAFAKSLNFEEVRFVPISALLGDNVVERSEVSPWYTGPTILNYLENVPIRPLATDTRLRMPIQTVIRPNLDYRGFAGQIASGSVAVGDTLMALPSGKTSTVSAIDVWEGALDAAKAPMSITVRLADEIDISRGDMLVHPDAAPTVTRAFDAMLVWMSETPLDPGKQYLIKHTTRHVRVNIDGVRFRSDLDTLEEVAADTLELNDIGNVAFTAHQPLYLDPYDVNRVTGAFILIDTLTNDTVAAGMIRGASAESAVEGARSAVSPRERAARLHQSGAIVVISGPTAESNSAVAYELERQLFDGQWLGHVLNGSDEGTAAAANQIAKAGLVAIVAGQAAGLDAETIVQVSVDNGDTDTADLGVTLGASGDDDDKAAKSIIAHLSGSGVLTSPR